MSTAHEAQIRERYGAAARAAGTGNASGTGCCGGGCGADPISGNLYEASQLDEVPGAAVTASLGCGNPTALAELRAGDVVLDLGSGGGIDVLLSARRVGPSGFAYGLDMTDEMLELARANQLTAGVSNAEFLRGSIESVPLPDATIDVIISNCVVNLAADKSAVVAEAFRVLRPGGRLAISDIVTRAALPAAVGESVALWTGCVAGAIVDRAFVTMLEAAGFTDVMIESTREFSRDDAGAMLREAGFEPGSGSDADAIAGQLYSAFVRATKPA